MKTQYSVYIPFVTKAPVPEMLMIVNRYRDDYGLKPLVAHPALMNVAQYWADTMRDTGNFEHGNLVERITKDYKPWKTIGENIAAGYLINSDAVRAWMDSPGHRDNILNPTFEEAGIGHAEGGTYQRWYVMDYGARFKT